MKRRLFIFVCLICIATSFPALSKAANAQTAKKEFVSRDADIAGAKIHYTTGGSGPAVLLLHGFAETSRMWNPLLPLLAEKFRVNNRNLGRHSDL